MPTLDQPIGDTNHSSIVQAFLDANDDIELAPGAVFNIGTVLHVTEGKRIFTDPDNPATLKRFGSTIRTCCLNGSGIRIQNCQFDWNFAGVWKSYHSHLAFSPPSGSGITFIPERDDIEIVGCRFIESTTPGTHNGNDCWCIAPAIGGVEMDIRNFKIIGCYSDNIVQLMGGGGIAGTWYDTEIAHNVVYNGRAAGMGISSQAEEALGYTTNYHGYRIHHNIIKNCSNIGIFIGQDGGSTVDGRVGITDLQIYNNIIELSGDQPFPTCILIRHGNKVGFTAEALVYNNVFDVRKSILSGGTPRAVQLQSSNEGSTLGFTNNKRLGNVTLAVTNTTLTASGNTNLGSETPWSVS